MTARHIDDDAASAAADLIAASSFGSDAAQAVSARADRRQVEATMQRITDHDFAEQVAAQTKDRATPTDPKAAHNPAPHTRVFEGPGPSPAGFAEALSVFHRAARHVPAYADFLTENAIDAESILTPRDFATVPPVTKANYLDRYPLDQLLWDRDITRVSVWSASSGAAATYWPRGRTSLGQSVQMYDRVFRNCFRSHERTTLLVIGFAMGNWTAGTHTFQTAVKLHESGHRISVIAPGLDIEEIRTDIALLGPYFDQVVLAGYPPLVKDVIDGASADVLGLNLRFLLAGENITEGWRNYLLDRLAKPSRAADACVVYGTADAEIIGYETAATIGIRRRANLDRALNFTLFGHETTQPTFVEYDPRLRYIESNEQADLLFTADGAIPLVRYRIGDQGTVITPAELDRVLRDHDVHDFHDLRDQTSGFLVMRARSETSASFYAVKIYPENIRPALEDDSIADAVSGTFIVASSPAGGDGVEQELRLQVELRQGVDVDSGLAAQISRLAVSALTRTNAEYREMHAILGQRAEPFVSLHLYGTLHNGGGKFAKASDRMLAGLAR